MRVPVKGMTVDLVGGGIVSVDGLYVEIPDPPPPAPGVEILRGSWLPVLGGDTGESGQAYTYQTGHYLKIGPLVSVWAYLQLSAKGQIDGALVVKGLPFHTATLPGFFAGVCSYSSNLSPNAADVSAIMLHAGGIATKALLFGHRLGQNPRPLVPADINDHTQLVVSLTYPADE